MRAFKIIFTFVFCLISVYDSKAQTNGFEELALNCYYDGYWTRWEIFDGLGVVSATGTFDGFSLYYSRYHPSEYFFKFFISNPSKYSDPEIRQHYRSKEWLEYEGVVEYYVTDEYPTIKDVLKGIRNRKLLWYTIGGHYNNQEDIYKLYGGIAVKRTVKAEVRIQPYKINHKWRVYNIWFDDVAVGISISNKVFF